MSMSPYFGPSDRGDPFSSSNLNAPFNLGSTERLSPGADAESRFVAHAALSGLRIEYMNIELARAWYGEYIDAIFPGEAPLPRASELEFSGFDLPDSLEAGPFEWRLVAACLDPKEHVILAEIRDRATGDILLPHPDDVLSDKPDRLHARARRFGENGFCGVLFSFIPKEGEFPESTDPRDSPLLNRSVLLTATPVLLPRLMRREAIRFHNGEADSLIADLFNRFARRELQGPHTHKLSFVSAVLSEDLSDDSLTMLLKDRSGRDYAARLVNPGGALLHTVEFFIPLSPGVEPTRRKNRLNVDLLHAFNSHHERLDYTPVGSDSLSSQLIEAVTDHLKTRFKDIWQDGWKVKIHQSTRSLEPPSHLHMFASIEEQSGLYVIPAPEGSAAAISRKLGGFLIHVDETPRTGVIASIFSAFGLTPQLDLAASIEEHLLHPKMLAGEIEKLVNDPAASILTTKVRSIIERDLQKRGKTGPVAGLTFPQCAAWSSGNGAVPLRAVLAKHDFGRHLVTFSFHETRGAIRPDADIEVAAFFPS